MAVQKNTTVTKKKLFLTKLIKEKSIKTLIDEYFSGVYRTIPNFRTLIVPSLLMHHAMIGTAYDYLIRIRLERSNKINTCLTEDSKIMSCTFIASVCQSQFTDQYKEAYDWAMTLYDEYLSTGLFTRELV